MKFIYALLIGLFTLIANQSEAQQPIYTQNTSSSSACDGSAYLDSAITYTTIVWANNGAVLQQGGSYILNLCAGTYIVTYTSTSGISTTLTFTIGSGTTNPCAGFALTALYTDASSSTACDGLAAVTPVNGTGPYTYQWSGGGALVNPNALCVGTYTVCATDANGCVVCDNVTISDASAQQDSLLIFNNNNFPGTPVAGVLSTASVEDCTIDYQNVGAAGVTSSVQVGTDTLLVTWTLWDTLGAVVSTYTIPYFVPSSANGLYSLALVVFCSQKSTNYNTIEINDHVMLSSNSITAIDQSMFKVINPMTDELTVIFAEQSSGTIAVLDASGKRVFSSQLNGAFKSTFDVSKLTAGVYMLEAVVNGKVYRTKLIK
jgi:hypothetical protein